ncbi:hypothetical protein Fmac_028023 [Flemingia macrophylla]|uniref:Uncharacterized protein n=1 Tax=Flemingia macrophylla TaxID=520843 RepID=A0ABD1LJD6_9FABA
MDRPSIDAYPSITFLRLPPTPPSSPAASVLANCFTSVKTSAPNTAAALAKIFHSAVVKALVIDLLCASAMEAASSLRILVYYFFTSGAAFLPVAAAG